MSNPTITAAPATPAAPDPEPWKKSKAKKLLKKDIIDGTVTDDMAPIFVYEVRIARNCRTVNACKIQIN